MGFYDSVGLGHSRARNAGASFWPQFTLNLDAALPPGIITLRLNPSWAAVAHGVITPRLTLTWGHSVTTRLTHIWGHSDTPRLTHIWGYQVTPHLTLYPLLIIYHFVAT